MRTLSIETSCDETSLAIIDSDEEGVRIHAHITHSQIATHAQYGGVFPHVAKREHAQILYPLLQTLIAESKLPTQSITVSPEHFSILEAWMKQEGELINAFKTPLSLPQIDRIAVTVGPGLEPTLWVGINFARALGLILNIPVIPVNHMEGHIMSSMFNTQSYTKQTPLNIPQFPTLALLISGGHTEFVLMKALGSYEVIGSTKDDAVGEAYDKVARMLDLPYPGGPKLSLLAEEERAQGKTVTFPRPMINTDSLDMSFSGLKTAVLYYIKEHGKTPGIAAGFEASITDVLKTKLHKALTKHEAKALIIAGGVIANTHLRNTFKDIADEFDIPLLLPEMKITGDNALMIGLASLHQQPADIHTLQATGTLSL